MKEFKDELFQNYKELREKNDKVCFIQNHFWDKAKIKDNFTIDYSGLLLYDDLIVRIFEDSLFQDDFLIITETNLVCIAISTLDCYKSKKIIKKYNTALINKPQQFRKEFEIRY